MADKSSTGRALQGPNGSGEYVVGAAVLLAAIIISASIYMSAGGLQKSIEAVKINYYGSGSGAAAASSGGVASSELKSKVEKFLDSNFLSSQGMRSEVTKVEPYGSHMYAATVNVKSGTSVLQSTTVYISLDGKEIVLGGQAFKANETVKSQGSSEPAQAKTVEKTDKPKAKAFIMSYCPYGLQMLKAYVPVLELLGSKADLEVGFVSYAMHGKKEIDGNNHIYCVQKESKPKLAAYLRCFVESGNYTSCIGTAGVDAAKTEACVAALDAQHNITGLYNDKTTWLSQAYPLYPVENAENELYGVQGSPTFVLNGVQVSTSRSAEAVKKAICDAFKAAPSECATTLSTSEEAPGLGKIGTNAAPAGTGTTAECG